MLYNVEGEMVGDTKDGKKKKKVDGGRWTGRREMLVILYKRWKGDMREKKKRWTTWRHR